MCLDSQKCGGSYTSGQDQRLGLFVVFRRWRTAKYHAWHWADSHITPDPLIRLHGIIKTIIQTAIIIVAPFCWIINAALQCHARGTVVFGKCRLLFRLRLAVHWVFIVFSDHLLDFSLERQKVTIISEWT